LLVRRPTTTTVFLPRPFIAGESEARLCGELSCGSGGTSLALAHTRAEDLRQMGLPRLYDAMANE
ncbi:MAG: hypothetical protein ACK5UP_08620, partial [Bacteroidota bacterium]